MNVALTLGEQERVASKLNVSSLDATRSYSLDVVVCL